MTLTRFAISLGLAFALCALSANSSTQQAQSSSTYTPAVGQEGKDVVWVPTPQALVNKMLDMAKVTTNDYVIDLGSGDGRTVITAAKRGTRAIGIEYNPDMVALSKRNAEIEGVADRAKFVTADLFQTDLSQATVITMFLLRNINLKLKPKILSLKPGTRVVSNTFTMGDWEADQTVKLDSSNGCPSSWCTALLWIVPAQVAGNYTIPQGQLSLKQNYQMLSGALQSEDRTMPVEGKVIGNEILLSVDGRELHGKVNGKRIELQARRNDALVARNK